MFKFNPMVALGLVAVCLIALAIVARNWSCKQHKEPRVHTNEYKVASVTSGVSLEVRIGIAGRLTKPLLLDGVIVPGNDMLAASSANNLEKLAGARVRVETPAGIFRLGNEEQGEQSEQTFEGELVEAPTLHGKVFGERGCCLQIEQLRAGLAETLGKVPAEYAAAQKEAKKAKRGMWSTK